MCIRDRWETALAKIESGEMNPDSFRKAIEVYAAQITEELLQVDVYKRQGQDGVEPVEISEEDIYAPEEFREI